MNQTIHSNPNSATADARLSTRRLADWRAFAAAAGAGLAAVSNADAAIIYVDPAVKPTAALPAPYTQPGQGTATFKIDGVTGKLTLRVQNGFLSGLASNRFNLINETTSNVKYVKPFAAGALITAAHAATRAALLYDSIGKGTTGDRFPHDKTGFAGFQLPASKGGGLGWMRIDMVNRDGDAYTDEIQVIDWAYTTAAGESILAGQVPEPSTKALALLALGSAGVLAWRKRRTQAAASSPAVA